MLALLPLLLQLAPCEPPGVVPPAACGTVRVWEDRQARRGRTIDLAVVVLRADGRPDEKRPDPIFLIAGGPGQGAAALAAELSRLAAAQRARRDIVLVDQRGTGASSPLRCDPPEGAPATVWHARAMFDPAVIGPCRDRLVRQADLAKYTTVDAADDLDDVRAALGAERVNLMGGSYGSRVVLVYLRRHPARVRAAVAWSLAPTDIANPLSFSRDAEDALGGLLADCRAEAACRRAFPDGQGDLRRALARLDAGPVALDVADRETGRPARIAVDRGWIAEAIRYALYSAETARRLPLALHEAAAGRWERLVAIGLDNRAGLGRQIALGMLMSVVCAEDVPLITPERTARETANTFLGDYRVRQQVAACARWPRGTLPADYAEPVRSQVPALLISGELDPATAPRHAERVRRTLPRSAHVIVPDAGHGWGAGLIGGSQCMGRVIESFLESADPGRIDRACVKEIRRREFVVE